MIFIRNDRLLGVKSVDKQFDVRCAGCEIRVTTVCDGGQAREVKAVDTDQGNKHQHPAPHLVSESGSEIGRAKLSCDQIIIN